MLNDFFVIPVVREKIKVRVALAIPALADEMTQTPLIVALKIIKFCLCNQKW